MQNRLSFAAVLLLATSISCVTTGSLKEVSPLAEKLSLYDGVQIQVVAPKPEHQGTVPLVKSTVELWLASFNKNQMSPKKPLALELTIVEVKAGNQLARTMNMGGETEISSDAKLTSEGRVIAAFHVTGNSARTSHASVNGIQVTKIQSQFDDLSQRAATGLAQQLYDYFKKHQ